MGSTPIRTVIYQLKNNSSSVVWSCCRNVTLFRGHSNKLGLTFKTICEQAGIDNCTLITRIKETCEYTGELNVSDRILAINDICIAGFSESEVSEIFEDLDVSEYHLVVQSVKLGTDDRTASEMSSEYLLPKVKRNMSSTSSHGATSQGSVDRPKSSGANKKLAKSSSSSLEHDHPVSPSVVSPFERSIVKPTPAPGHKKNAEHSVAHAYHPLVDIDQITGRSDGTAASAGAHVFCQADVRPPGVPMPHQWNWAGHETSYSYNRTQSLPVSCDEDIGLEEITCEVQSLPLQSGAANQSGTAAPSSFYSQDSGLGGSKLQEPGQLDIPVCRTQLCQVQHCLWHMAVLKFPQHVIWDPGTKTVMLEKNPQTAYGFHYKIKIHVHPRETCMYALVDKVEKVKPAFGKLEIGDWIRSVNGHALQSMEADSLNIIIHKSSSLRLVIQRPTGISQKGSTSIKGMLKNLRPLQMPHRPKTKSSPGPLRHPSTMGQRTSTGITNLSPRVVSPLASCPAGQVQSCKCCGQDRGLSPDRMISNPLSSSTSSVDNSVRAVSPTNGLPLNAPMELPIPKVRIFICGNKSNVFANLLVMGASEEARIPLESHVHYSRLCLRKNDQSRVTFDKWQFGLTENRDKSVAPDSPQNTTTNQWLSFPNVKQISADIFIIWDENFFHHCSHFLFTKNSVFLIAFDAHKLLNLASTEISRIENILHTIRSFASDSALVQLHGILSSETVKADEVRTLFYTSHGKQLGRYAISIPDIVFLQKDEDLSVLDGLRSSIFDIANSSCTTQSVSMKSLQLSEALSGTEGRTRCVWSSEDLAVLLQSVYDKNFLQRSTAQELIQLGDLVPVSISGHSGSDQYIIPVDILPRLAHLVLWAGVETSPNSMSISAIEAWTKLLTTATLTHGELRLLLDKNIVDSATFITCLESLGIIFKISPPSSGATSAGTSYLIPYFLVDCHPSEQVPEQESSHELFVGFKKRIPWVTFFRIVSSLGLVAESSTVKMSGPCCCSVVLEGVPVTLVFLKTLDRVTILIQKGHGTPKERVALDVMRKVLVSSLPRDEDCIFGPACPLTDNHRGSTGHALDMSCASNITCSGLLLDQHPTVRLWLSSGSQDNSENITAGYSNEDKLKQSFMTLPFSVFQKVITRLTIKHSNDWKDLAARIGKTLDDVMVYEAVAVNHLPAEELLKEWGRSSEGTIANLLQALKDMDRPDIYDHITEYLQQ
ncbi:uncharacterized protein LOC121368043 [Gigantopelta aegis]|uniref:uncharacterized protein LOC121368043 n=1 Tax=Gigantopelta aegis TaxID=1735272 RepID=UPI001B88863D|nr:uncharacterized protein LOC121368043 [Gigantopelta aegis]